MNDGSNINRLLSTIMMVLLIIILWPLIQWLIIVVLVLILIAYFTFKSKVKKIRKEYEENTDFYTSDDEYDNNIDSNDIIDVDFTESDDDGSDD